MRRLVEILELTFRLVVVYPLLRLVFRNPLSSAPVDLNKVERLLIFRYDRIGDMIVTTPILRALKSRNPRLQLGVVASRLNAELLQNNPFVDDLYVLPSNWFDLLSQVVQIRRQRYDVVLNFIFNRTTSSGILANLVAPGGHKVGHGADRYAFYFNRLLRLPLFDQHMVESLASYVQQVFGIALNEEELRFEIFVSDDSKRRVDEFLEAQRLHRCSLPRAHSSPYVLFNLSVRDHDRRVSPEQAATLARNLAEKTEFRTVLLIEPGDREMEKTTASRREFADCLVYQTEGERPLAQIASLVEGALLVITPDTSIVHFASAMRTPVIGLYTQQLQGTKEWLPFRVPYEMLMAPVGEPSSAIPPETLIQVSDKFIASLLGSSQPAISKGL
ncbi:MAG: hypothetical protein HW389_2307 [Bacteroidetes bacterium]|nr:hypothetical protein [Bacteroidota bacterium]